MNAVPASAVRATRWPALAYAGLSVIDAGLAAAGRRRLRRVTKPALMPLLHLAVTRRADHGRAGLRRGAATARAGSWAGDVALLGEGEAAFLTGVGSFAVAHAAYIAGFVTARDDRADLSGAGPVAAAVTWAIAAPVMARAAGRTAPELRAPVAAYAGILATMSATSTLLDRDIPLAVRRRIMAGTALFLLSDGLIGTKDFLLEDTSPALEAAVMLTYTAGQWLIADGVRRT